MVVRFLRRPLLPRNLKRIKIDMETTNMFSGFAWMMVLAQIINLCIIGAIVAGIIYFWKRISGWNKERNYLLQSISFELGEIKKEMRKNRGL